ncbi:FAD-binding oxidoreductase [Rathayibacter iranicus]|uniref:Ferredoxin-NADP reductase n=1 Tax=Rathayibacter iranicus NCPPB 2253 = VKM Ac-1602 TaxID=1328868 RepID=A0ABX5LA17_9MICO|nr:FAD-binding oxidoreductase [Rathayibacter iranicus]PWJ62249.1 ferredoxin-NADP reductase [Rathayibacter iranicus] [Rathayibacter iranicus NCPPB 2253 = VKM Ac-1602]
MRWTEAVAESVAPLTPTSRLLLLRVPGWPGHIAGQHLDVRLTAPDGYQASRSYSIGAPSDGDRVELAVERLEDGEVSPYLVNGLEAGDRLEVRGPIGGWFVWRPEQREPVQLIAGGSGVVPLVAMAREHARSASAARMQLLYSVRSPAFVYYRDELAALAEQPEGSGAVAVDLVYSRVAPAGAACPAGRVTGSLLADAALPASLEPTVYVCGPTSFVDTVATALVAQGHSPSRVRTERFGGA